MTSSGFFMPFFRSIIRSVPPAKKAILPLKAETPSNNSFKVVGPKKPYPLYAFIDFPPLSEVLSSGLLNRANDFDIPRTTTKVTRNSDPDLRFTRMRILHQ